MHMNLVREQGATPNMFDVQNVLNPGTCSSITIKDYCACVKAGWPALAVDADRPRDVRWQGSGWLDDGGLVE